MQSPLATRRTLLTMAAILALPLPLGAAPRGIRSAEAPISIAHLGLRAKDAEALSLWYQQVLGLKPHPVGTDGRLLLGTEDEVLLEIIGDPTLRIAERREAGLYHTAFLLPSRTDLARWIRHAIDKQIPVDGASDHLVSEAVYLTDPEGNGVEICVDRAPEVWDWSGDQVRMGTEALDIESLVALDALLPVFWSGAPKGTIIGHVHLKVGDAKKAERFWREDLKFDTVRAREGAVFLSTGGYHHHIACNTWESADAGPRDPKATGLAHVTLWDRTEKAAARTLTDPWGSEIHLIPR